MSAPGSFLNYLRGLLRPTEQAEQSDAALLRRFTATRDETAFATLMQRHGPMVHSVCRRLLPDDAHTADDAFQATFLLLARRAEQVRRPEAVGCWLFGVARRTAQRARAQAARRKVREREAALRRPEEAPVDPGWSELLDVLDEELTRLPERYRAPLLLCFREGCTRDEAARRLGWSLSSVRRRLDRGRELLRARMVTRGATLAGGLWGAALLSEASAAVPPALANATLQTALVAVSGGSVTGAVAALAESVSPASNAGRFGAVGVLLAACVAVGLGLLSVFRSPAPQPTPPAPAPAVAATADDLPDGARARLGSGRFWHGLAVEAVAFTPDDRLLAGVGLDGRVSFWEASTGRFVRQVRSDLSRFGPCRIAFAPDGRSVAVASKDGALAMLDVATGRALHTFGGTLGGDLAWSPDGSRIATVCGVRNVINWKRRPPDAAVLLWAPDGKLLATMHGHTEDALAVAFSPDGRTLATAGEDGIVRMWDPKNAQAIEHFRAETGRGLAVAFRPDGAALAVGCGDGTVRLLDPETGRERHRLAARTQRVIAVAFAPDGKTLAAAGGEGDVRVWDAETGAEQAPFPRRGNAGVGTLTFSADGTKLAFAGDQVYDAGTPRVWDVATRRDAVTFDGHRGQVFASAFAPDGRTVVTAGGDGVLILWDAEKGKEVRRLDGHDGRAETVAFAPDGATLISGGSDGCVRLWDLAAGREVRRHDPLWEDWGRPVLSADGGTVVVPGRGTTPRLWRVADWRERPAGSEHETRLFAAALSRDGGLLATAAARTLRLWDRATTRERWRSALRAEQQVGSLAFSPDGTLLAVGLLRGPTVELWDVEKGKPRGRLEGAGAKATVTALQFSPDGKTLAVAADGVRLWDVGSMRPRTRLQGHRSAVLTLSFAPDGKTLLSGGADAVAFLWAVPADEAERHP